MALTINLLNVPPCGLETHHEVEPSALSLSPDEGTLIGSLNCRGTLLLTGERSAHFEGVLTGRVSRECVRCLAVFEEALSVSFEAQFQKPANGILSNSVKAKGGKGLEVALDENALEEEEDAYPITGNDIDLLPAIREYVILATPVHPLCKEECLGLCQICGINLNEGMCACCTPVTASSPVEPVKQAVFKQNQPKRSSVTARRKS
jgi:uncharacterized protein